MLFLQYIQSKYYEKNLDFNLLHCFNSGNLVY